MTEILKKIWLFVPQQSLTFQNVGFFLGLSGRVIRVVLLLCPPFLLVLVVILFVGGSRALGLGFLT